MEESRQTGQLLHYIEPTGLDIRMKRSVEIFSLQLEQNRLFIVAWRLFVVNYNIVYSVSSIIYFVSFTIHISICLINLFDFFFLDSWGSYQLFNYFNSIRYGIK